MRDIDRVADSMIATVFDLPGFAPLKPFIKDFADAARRESETMKSDPDIFKIWPRFVACGDAVQHFRPDEAEYESEHGHLYLQEMLRSIVDGKQVIEYLAGARVPMPKTTDNFAQRGKELRNKARPF